MRHRTGGGSGTPARSSKRRSVEASNDDRIAREEVFGPVAALIPFAGEEDAIRIANDTPYGLSGSIWTENGGRAPRVARALESGVLSINSNSSVRPSTPFGGGGSVINVASFVALLGAATSQISYTASKGAVLAMTRELGVQFARQGVRVNALCPGPVETPLLLSIWGDDPAAAERRLVHIPMGRLAKPREIVNAALFLASDESSYVNAATFVVDGGITGAYVTPE
ncbi:MAG: SDR family oxidoreductase [Gaiellaceae bacterium]